MAISQAFNPFEHTVGKGGFNWVLFIVLLAIVLGIGYYIYKDQIVIETH